MRCTKKQLETRISALEHHIQHHSEVAAAQEKRADIAEDQRRNVCSALEAERTVLLARVAQIDVLLALGGRTRSRGASPEF